MKCDSSAANVKKLPAMHLDQELCPKEESSSDTKDMQLIYNKKRRFHHQPNKLPRSSSSSCASPTPRNISSFIQRRRGERQDEALDDCNEGDGDEDEDELDEVEEEEMHKFRISSAHKSKLLLPPHLYKSFLANAFRQQQQQQQNHHHHPNEANAIPSGDSSPSTLENRPFNASSMASFSGGLHIFPRNLLFSCSSDRKSPTVSSAGPSSSSSSSLYQQSCSRAKTDLEVPICIQFNSH